MSVITCATVQAHEVAESTIRGLIKGVGVHAFLIGLHNSFVHGKILEEEGTDFSEEQLGQMFEAFEKLIAISKEM